MSEKSLTNYLLVAMPDLKDPNFAEAVIYVAGHDPEQGARGFVINRETGLRVTNVFERLGIAVKDGLDIPDLVYMGGPVMPEHGYLVHREPAEYMVSEQVSPFVSLTLSRDILADLARGRGPATRLFFLGYSGWAPGQLEAELLAGTWLTVPATPEILYEIPARDRYDYALRMLGLDRETLLGAEGTKGHA